MPRVTIRLECSKGTYIRTLAHDLGRALGCGAHLAALTRLAVGTFRLEEALPLALVEQHPEEMHRRLIPLAMCLPRYQAVRVDRQEARRAEPGSGPPLAGARSGGRGKGAGRGRREPRGGGRGAQ